MCSIGVGPGKSQGTRWKECTNIASKAAAVKPPGGSAFPGASLLGQDSLAVHVCKVSLEPQVSCVPMQYRRFWVCSVR